MTFAAAIALLVLAAPGAGRGQQPTAPPPARVVVAEAIQQDVIAGQSFVATILPVKRAVIGSAVDGRVDQRYVDVGDRVESRQPLIQLLTNTIELELRAAEAELELRGQELSELENGARQDEIEQAKAKMLGADAERKFSLLQRDRLRKLRASQATAQGILDEAEAAYDQANQVFLDAASAYQLVKDGPRPEKIEQAKAVVAMQQARVDLIKDRINKYTLMSRFDGYVTHQYVEIGAWVKTGDPVLEVIELDEVELQAYVGESHIAFVRPGTEVSVSVPAIPDRVFTGIIKAIIPQADTQSRTFPVNIRVKNEVGPAGPILKSGYLARVNLPTGTTQAAVLVPKDALVLGGGQLLVYVVNEGAAGKGDGSTAAGKLTAVPIPVELGVASGGMYQVIGDIRAGQRVIVEGNERVRPGQELTITTASGG